MEAGSIWVKLGLDPSELRFGLDKARYGLMEWRDQVNTNSMEMAKWGAAITAEVAPLAALSLAIWDATTKAGAMGKTIKDNARDLGLTNTEYQQWSHAITAAGGNADGMTESFRQMTVRMKEAVDPTSDVGQQFAALGVKVTDAKGNMRSTNDVMLDTFAAINRLPEGMARNQAQMTIFGRGFSNISDLAGLTREELQALLNQAPIVDDDKIRKMDAFQTKLALVNEQWEIMYAEVGTELIPVVEELIPLVSDYGVPAFGSLASVLELSSRGFRIMSESSKSWRQTLTGDIEGAKKTMSDLDSWIEAQQTKDAAKASGYTDGAMWDGTKWVRATKAASLAPTYTDKDAQKTAEDAQKSRVKSLNEAWKEYQDQIKKVADETKKLQDINRDFERELSILNPSDVSAARNLIIKHKWAVEDQQANVTSTRSGLLTSASAMGKAAGNLIINLDGKQLAKVPGVISSDANLKDQRIQAGIRTASS